MNRTRVIGAAVIAGVLLAAAACSVGDFDALSTSAGGDGGATGSRDASAAPPTFGDGGATGTAMGVVLVHAAAFPAFRLCFENYPDILPQPDAKVMPQANVVGVETGRAVRIGPMPRAPGAVYIFPQEFVAATPEDAQDLPCGKRITKQDKNSRYFVAGRIDVPIGVGRADLFVVSGCANGYWLEQLGIPQTDCPGYNATAATGGQLGTRVFPLETTTTSTLDQLPVQLLSLSSELEQYRPQGLNVDVTFGALDAGPGERLAQPVATAVEPYDASAGAILRFDQSSESTFGTHGFRVAYRPADGGTTAVDGAASLSIDQTLAEVQSASRFEANPTTYFLTPTNYALLLLGDPRIRPKLADGGANEAFDARRAVHLVAVPVRDEVDAGPLGGDWDAGPAPDASPNSDAGSK